MAGVIAERPLFQQAQRLRSYDILSDAAEVVDSLEDREDRLENAKRKKDFMEDPWGSFPQLMYARNMIGPNGGIITKIAAYSFPAPPGTTTNMGIRIQKEAMELTGEEIHTWKGVQEGNMFGVKKYIDTQDGRVDTSGIRRLSHAAAVVIADRHQYGDHTSVQKFFIEHNKRIKHLDEAEMHIQTILDTPEHLGISADKFPGMYGFVLEYVVDEEGHMWGTSLKGEKTLMSKIADDKPHQEWMSWFGGSIEVFRREYQMALENGDQEMFKKVLKIGHFNNSERVSDCGGSTGRDGCSRFFKDQITLPEEKERETIFNSNSVPDHHHAALHVIGYMPSEKKEEGCPKGHEAGKCDCQPAEEEYIADAA